MTITLNGTTGITLPNGSASAPAATGSDTDTGIVYGTNTVQVATGGTTAVTVSSAQNVGIGSSSPSFRLTVSDTAGGNVVNVTNNADADFKINCTSGVTKIGPTTGVLAFQSDGTTERMRIDSGGRLNIGTTSSYDFAVLNLYRNGTDTSALVQNIFNNAATSTTKKSNVILRISSNANNADAYINITDNVANNYNFGGNNGGAYVQANTNGVRLTNGATSWSSDSDERVKDIIEPITDAANKVSTLRAVIGKYKTDAEGTRRSFLIAQDVQAVLPEAVVAQEDEIGTLSLAYTDTIPLLVAAIQELKAELDTVKTELATLKGTA